MLKYVFNNLDISEENRRGLVGIKTF